jgi:hypothetical protein
MREVVMAKLLAQHAPQIGTWYFDKWTCRYVQVVAGAQAEGYITVEDTRGIGGDWICSIPAADLDLQRYWTPKH